jgi:hypothetical protein
MKNKNNHGGKRVGAGRKPLYESYKLLRLPTELLNKIDGNKSKFVRDAIVKALKENEKSL